MEINGLVLCFVLSMLLEWPFRIMAKLVLQTPRRVMLRLKDDLAHALRQGNEGGDMLDEITMDDDDVEELDKQHPVNIKKHVERHSTNNQPQTTTGHFIRTSLNADEADEMDMQSESDGDSLYFKNTQKDIRKLASIEEEETDGADSSRSSAEWSMKLKKH